MAVKPLIPAACLIACVLLLGCAPSLLDYQAQTHVVRRGETLYTIAWQYGVDYRELARWNSLANPNRIYPGQQLRVRAPAVNTVRPAAANRAAAEAPPQRRSDTPRSVPARPADAAAAARSAPSPSAAARPGAQNPSGAAAVVRPAWAWPTTGLVVARFGSGDGIGSGIALSGASGQPVYAAAAGTVVYVGTGLAGYGQLVIIKHSDAYLSAYGHTDQVRVAQGETVTRGQQIAAMGMGPRRQPRLHFEIRLNGVPIDPLGELPPQS